MNNARLLGLTAGKCLGIFSKILLKHLRAAIDVSFPNPENGPPRFAGKGGRVRPRKILIHAINYAPELIGCGKYTTEFALYLVQCGHSVEVVTASPHYPGWYVRPPYRSWVYLRETLDGVCVFRCPMAMRKNGRGLWRLLAPLSFAIFASPVVAWRILRFRPETVLCLEPTAFSIPVALCAAKLAGARTVLHVQDLEIDAAFEVGHVKGPAIRRAALALERTLLRGFDRVVTISEKMREALLAKGVAPTKLTVVRNWVDLEVISPTVRGTPNTFRVELNIASEEFVALYAGHIGAKQALDVVLKAARRLSGEKRIHFVIAGDGPMREPLQEQFGDLSQVHYLPLQPAERLSELLGLADVHLLPQMKGAADLVLPSKLGGMLASGRPIVATAEPGTEIWNILQGVALVTPVGDDDALAGAILWARSADLSDNVERGLQLARTLSSTRLLASFENLLVQEEAPAPGRATVEPTEAA